MKVLLVDDDSYINKVISISLRKIGHFDVIDTNSGYSAVKLAKEQKPDVILLDMYMPELDGLGTLKILKADESTSKIPVILCSAESDHDLKNQILELGAIGIISKPFDPMKISDQVKSLLKVIQ